MTLSAGSKLGPYSIVSKLGAGGMGEVYRAHDPKLGRDVAIKVLPANTAKDPDTLSRFEREAKAVAALQHPHILAIFDFGDQDGVAYAVMELLEGDSLKTRIAAGPIPQRKVIEYALQVAQGLAAAHQKGIVHRDIKPDNIFITKDEIVKILDFGLAKQSQLAGELDPNAPTAGVTQAGAVMGTIGYMAPEQVRGHPADHRADVFAFGAVLYEMITGQRAFKAESTVETMSAILTSEPPEMESSDRQIPMGLRRIVDRCLEKVPERRFQSATDLAFALENLSTATGPSSIQSGPVGIVSGPAAVVAPPSRRPWAIAAGVALLLAAASFYAGRRLGAPKAAGGEGRAGGTFVRLAEQPGGIGSACVAPDGSAIAFVGYQAGNADIYFQRVGGRNPINLTKDSNKDDVAPSFSPDGQMIAFRSERGSGGIYTMGATGESVKRVSETGYDPDWSPDGKELVVATANVVNPLSRPGTSQLWIVTLATGVKRLLTSGDAVQPSWSPNGSRIAYWGVPLGTGKREIYTIEVAGEKAGAKPVPVVSDAALNWNPVWSPDGKYLYYSSDRAGTMNLWRVPINERTGEATGDSEPITTPSRWACAPSLSRDGKLLVYTSLDQRSDIHTVAFDPASESVVGEPKLALPPSSEIRGQDVSPDGTRITFTTLTSPESLYVVNRDGSGFVQLTDDTYRDRGPRWSPDGKKIAFFTNRSGRFEIWSVEPDGSSLGQVTTTTGPGLYYPVWSPDGTKIASPTAKSSKIFSMGQKEKDPGKELPPIDKEHVFWATSWSPDGRSLAGAYLAEDGGIENGFYRYTLEGGTYEKLSETGTFPKWLSDGVRLLYLEREEGAIYLLNTKTKKAKKVQSILPGHRATSLWGIIAVAKNDRVISWVDTTREGGIWALKF